MTAPVHRFGDCRIDLSARELHCSGVLVTLSPKVFDCLAYLIAHRDRAVGRDELIAAVWGRADVSDTLLGQTVLKARRAIGDTGNEQNAIRTVPRFGYRWIAAIDAAEPAAAAADAPAPAAGEGPATSAGVGEAPVPPADPAPARAVPRRPSRALLGGVIAIAVAALASGLWLRQAHRGAPATSAGALGEPAARSRNAAAVLPVEVSGQGDWSWLRLGLMDLVATRMRAAGLAVVPSDNVVALLRERTADPAAGAKNVAEGTGARIIVLPAASRSAGAWSVRLTLREPDRVERVVESRDTDVIEAGRNATDRLLALFGKRAPARDSAARDLPAGELISRAEAALLSDDLAGARRLLESAPESAQRSPELRLRLAQIDFRAGQLDAARTRLQGLLAEVSAESDAVLRARILDAAGAVDIRSEHPADGERAFGQAIALLENRSEPAALGQAYTGRAISYAAQGRYDAALADFARARVALELAGDRLALARVEENEGIVSAKRGRYPEALAAHLRSAQRFERFGALNELAGTLGNAANAQLELLLPANALATTERARALIGALENRATRNALQVERAAALAQTGRLAEARALLAELADAADGDDMLLARIHLEQGALDFDGGRFDSAADLAGSATAAFDNQDYLRERADAWLLWTRALRAQHRDTGAREQVARLQAWAQDRALAPMPVYAALAGAEADWSARRRDAAYAAYDGALVQAERNGVPADTAKVAVSYAASLIADGELERASAVVGQVARWSEHDFTCALLQVRYYHALGEHAAWESALAQARRLAGERPIPAALERPPATAGASAAARVP
jgi:DNA-binding winged helix-turn-helix (wHTH) protein/tetratricopeptide (TPR) repeat protein